MTKKFEKQTLVNDAGDSVEVTSRAEFNQFVYGYGYKLQSGDKATKKSENK